MSNGNEKKSFWTTVPGILTGCAAILTAVGGLIAILVGTGLYPPSPPTRTPIIPKSVTEPAVAPTFTVVPPGMPDLYVSEFSLQPSIPIQGEAVSVRVGVYNQGTGRAGPFTVEWWAGENYPEPACVWEVDGLVARGGKILTCNYDGYPSRYARIRTKVVVDAADEVTESDETNNVRVETIQVRQAE